MKNYKASEDRYDKMIFNRVGLSGLKLPAVSLGLWHNFGDIDDMEEGRRILHRAFDSGITHFDLANNYGTPNGSAEENFGKVLNTEFKPYRDEMIISSKAGYYMWPGPYGDWGSRKYLMASIDQSLKRLGLDYVDIFYHHRPDPDTPLEETMGALHSIVEMGKSLYVGISNYPPEKTREAVKILREMGTPCLIHQFRYSMFERKPEAGLLQVFEETGIGGIAFSALAQGLLTDKYLEGIPKGSRADQKHIPFLTSDHVTPEIIEKVRKLNELAEQRGQELSQMALGWVLRQPAVASVLIGVSSNKQLEKNLACLENPDFTEDELKQINRILE